MDDGTWDVVVGNISIMDRILTLHRIATDIPISWYTNISRQSSYTVRDVMMRLMRLIIEVSVVFVGLNMIVMAAVVYLQAAAATKPIEQYNGLGLDALLLPASSPSAAPSATVMAGNGNGNDEVKSAVPSVAESVSSTSQRGWQSYNTPRLRAIVFALDLAILIAYAIVVQLESIDGKGVGWLTLAAISILGTPPSFIIMHTNA